MSMCVYLPFLSSLAPSLSLSPCSKHQSSSSSSSSDSDSDSESEDDEDEEMIGGGGGTFFNPLLMDDVRGV